MKRLGTTVSCLALLLFGWVIGQKDDTHVSAAPPDYYQPSVKPVDLQLDFYKGAVESLVKRLEGGRDTIQVTKTVTKKVPTPVYIYKRDTLYVPLIFIAKLADREEETVNDNHSTGDDIVVVSNEDSVSVSEQIQNLQIRSAYLTIQFSLIWQVSLACWTKRTWSENMLALSKGEKLKRQDEIRIV